MRAKPKSEDQMTVEEFTALGKRALISAADIYPSIPLGKRAGRRTR